MTPLIKQKLFDFSFRRNIFAVFPVKMQWTTVEILQFSIVFIFAIFLVIHTVLKEQNALFLRDSGHSALRMNILQ